MKLELTNIDQLRVEFDETGLVQQCFPLSDSSLLPPLITEYESEFEKQIQKNRSLNRVPYKITENIRKAAHDHNISKVIKSVLGESEPWVMWGANIQSGTPNQAYEWHADFESVFFPTITLMLGLKGCSELNATTCIPFSQHMKRGPGKKWCNASAQEIIRYTSSLDSRCNTMKQFSDFSDGKFYIFNAKTWHAGDISSSKSRMLLIMHYQKASDPRIPQMKDYQKGTWFSYPAPYLVEDGYEHKANQDLYQVKRTKWKIARAVKRKVKRVLGM